MVLTKLTNEELDESVPVDANALDWLRSDWAARIAEMNEMGLPDRERADVLYVTGTLRELSRLTLRDFATRRDLLCAIYATLRRDLLRALFAALTFAEIVAPHRTFRSTLAVPRQCKRLPKSYAQLLHRHSLGVLHPRA